LQSDSPAGPERTARVTGPLVVGLTGPMGSGKSAVLGWLRELGAECLRADDASRELLSQDACLLSRVREQLGEGVFHADGRLDRARTAAMIFADPQARRRLELVTHGPMVRWLEDRVKRLRGQSPPPRLIVVEAAILTHMGARELVDVVVRVSASREACLARIQARDGISRREAEARLALQDDLGLFDEPADYVLDTSGSLHEAREATRELWNRLVAGGQWESR